MSELRGEWPGSPAVEGVDTSAPAVIEAEVGARPVGAEKVSGWWAVGVPVALYVFSAALLLVALDSHPNFTYNWENNTASGLFNFTSNPTVNIFHMTQGLMTD